ncbi:MAG: N-acetylmuramoyl-L-alanine amidase family protein, partial [Chroococcales cyanobacterium]
TNHSRLTPLIKGTRAAITGREGEWIRLDYGAWIREGEARILSAGIPPRSAIRGVRSRQVPGWTEVLFPLQTAVPVTVNQGDRQLSLTLHNTIAQTDTIAFNDDPLVQRMDWQPLDSDRIEYTFHFKPSHQWGYKMRYEGTTLILSLRHPPNVTGSRNQPLAGMRILIDPGHGSSEDLGARGPTGYPEKDVNLVVSNLLRDELQQRGATVLMTREGDEDLWPHDRVEQIERDEPHLALSVHYNALPDFGDAINTAGIGMFWYHPQAHDLSVFLHNYLVEKLNRPSYGVFWNNLALTRPTVAPSILLELGFMINPTEFEWIVDEQEQKRLAKTLADGIVDWFATTR